MNELVFLKLGGSLITDKGARYSVRLDRLRGLCREIHTALETLPHMRLVVGHGSGSFGHVAMKEHLDPARIPASNAGRDRTDRVYWNGFAEVWYRASQLNRHVIECLHEVGVPALSLAPSSAVTATSGAIENWDLSPVLAALASGVLPVIFGDIVFDRILGGKVLSTEVLMWHLARELRPQRILLAGIEAAVWADYPTRVHAINKITPASMAAVGGNIGGSHGADVTGGMRSKVQEMLTLVQVVQGLEVRIFSGEEQGNLLRALAGESLGTLISGD